jgi:hypothetical protein
MSLPPRILRSFLSSYKTKDAFLQDVLLMCNNCRAFNCKTPNNFADCADQVEQFVAPRVRALYAL